MSERRPFFDVVRRVLAPGAPWSPAERLVALALGNRLRIVDGRAQAWPGVADLASRTGLCERSVRSTLKPLCSESGLFMRVRRTNRRGRASDLFVLRAPATASEVPATIAAGSGSDCRAIDEPPIEPPIEPPREPESVALGASPSNGNGNGAPATRIFEVWRETFGKDGAAFTEERRLFVRSALRHFTEAVLEDAVRGAAMLPEETRGRNGECRDDLTDLLRFGDKVQRCASWARKRREDEEARRRAV